MPTSVRKLSFMEGLTIEEPAPWKRGLSAKSPIKHTFWLPRGRTPSFFKSTMLSSAHLRAAAWWADISYSFTALFTAASVVIANSISLSRHSSTSDSSSVPSSSAAYTSSAP